MKKIISSLLFTVLVLGGLTANAQFEKGDKLLNLGLNLGGTYGGGGIGIGGSYEVGIHDFISVGGQADFVSWSNGFGGYKWKYNFLTLGVRGSYHFGKHFLENDKLDLYAGPAIGYTISKYKDPSGWSGSYVNDYGSGVFFGAFAGARYYFKPSMGVFGEAGYNASPLKVGITFKM